MNAHATIPLLTVFTRDRRTAPAPSPCASLVCLVALLATACAGSTASTPDDAGTVICGYGTLPCGDVCVAQAFFTQVCPEPSSGGGSGSSSGSSASGSRSDAGSSTGSMQVSPTRWPLSRTA